MAKQFMKLDQKLMDFIATQKMFFVATAAPSGRVNLSPKGMDSIKVIDSNRVAWLNVTGSGNETSAHVQVDPRMTIMFCAFDGAPMILRLYGHAKEILAGDQQWGEMLALFPSMPGTRQIFDMTIDLVQTSCGMAVPFYDYVADRDLLNTWAEKKGQAGIEEYWLEKNQTSIDGLPSRFKQGIEG